MNHRQNADADITTGIRTGRLPGTLRLVSRAHGTFRNSQRSFTNRSRCRLSLGELAAEGRDSGTEQQSAASLIATQQISQLFLWGRLFQNPVTGNFPRTVWLYAGVALNFASRLFVELTLMH